jgi:ACS family glucarate transporter-like MFS transporter
MMLNMFQYFAGNFTFFICISWFHPYLVANYRISEGQAARFAMIPLLGGALANWVSGLFVDALYKRGLRAWSRRLPAIIGFVLASSGVFAVSLAETSSAAVIAFAVATFGVEMTISPSWAFCLDIGGANSGAVSASMNMVGNFGGFVSANAFPLLQRLAGSSAAYFRVAAALNIAAMLCWFLMRARQEAAARRAPAAASVQGSNGAG